VAFRFGLRSVGTTPRFSSLVKFRMGEAVYHVQDNGVGFAIPANSHRVCCLVVHARDLRPGRETALPFNVR